MGNKVASQSEQDELFKGHNSTVVTRKRAKAIRRGTSQYDKLASLSCLFELFFKLSLIPERKFYKKKAE